MIEIVVEVGEIILIEVGVAIDIPAQEQYRAAVSGGCLYGTDRQSCGDTGTGDLKGDGLRLILGRRLLDAASA